MNKNYGDLTEDDYEHKSHIFEGEEIYFKTAITANTPQDFSNLDNSQKLFIKHNLENADVLIKKYQPSLSIDNFTAVILDDMIDKWNSDSSKFNCSSDYFINSIGTAFGHYLIKNCEMKWTIVTDEYGTDYATTIERIKLTNFPLNSVAKAIDQKRQGSLQSIFLLTKQQINEIRNLK